MNMKTGDMVHAAELLDKASHIGVLTGAGISAESGLATFRDSDGLWNNHPVEEVATPEGFFAAPQKVWRFYNELRAEAKTARPNPAHAALSAAHDNGRRVSVITQNVDGLHQRAGSPEVIELHGTLWAARCTRCAQRVEDLAAGYTDCPVCAACGALLRPDIVWFGEPLPQDALARAELAVRDCQAFIMVGTSAQVYPAAGFAVMAIRRAIPVIEVNMEKTPLSSLATVSILGKAGTILPQLLKIHS
ncbi:MAG: NAD-dependent deacylase [Elusimicrobiaceae bacterium]|nr:NAD-dependent deacylase [Elusimicrobiaceae bacterium]